MRDRWVVSDEYPNGHLVPMTPAEQAQRDQDDAAGAALAAAQESAAAALAARMATLREARTAMASGAIFGSLSARERDVIVAMLEQLSAT